MPMIIPVMMAASLAPLVTGAMLLSKHGKQLEASDQASHKWVIAVVAASGFAFFASAMAMWSGMGGGMGGGRFARMMSMGSTRVHPAIIAGYVTLLLVAASLKGGPCKDAGCHKALNAFKNWSAVSAAFTTLLFIVECSGGSGVMYV